jgi:outer membrane protein OmpA-like peptidoglycan-associated protein
MRAHRWFVLPALALLCALLAACAQTGLEWAPKGPYLGYHKELPAAERAVNAARAGGRDRECPAEFAAAEKKKDEAYQVYWACRTQEAIALANDAVAMANALCPRKAEPVPMPPAVPTVSLSASPTAVQRGQCATLSWTSTSATGAALDQGIGSVAPSGSREVCPGSTTSYRLTATGPGGTQTASATVGVTEPPPPVPTVSLSASPTGVQRGQCATLSWTSTSATGAALDQGIGSVAPSGSREVCPGSTTSYRLTATGPGGTQTASATVGVTEPPPPPAPEPVARLTLRINFETDRATIRQEDVAELQKAVEFVKRYPDHRIAIGGHTDNVGDARYNQRLSEQRAAAVKDYLLQNGVTGADRITTVGYGEDRPVAPNTTQDGRLQNRRVEVNILPK